MKKMNKMYDPYSLGLEVTKIAGAEAICLCPFHKDSNPSSSINMMTGWFYCFACGKKAHAEEIASLLGGTVEEWMGESEIAHCIHALGGEEADWSRIGLSPLALGNPYLKSRQVSDDLVEWHGILCVNNDTIAFPFKKNGVVIGYQTRSMYSKRYRFYGKRTAVWGKPTPVWTMGASSLNVGGPVFATEGVFGALRGMGAGVDAVAICGSSNTDGLEELAGYDLYTMFDDDPAGHKASARALSIGLPFCKIKNLEPDELTTKQWREITGNVGAYFSWSLEDLCSRASKWGEKHKESVVLEYRKETHRMTR